VAASIAIAGSVAVEPPQIDLFFDAISPDASRSRPALRQIGQSWRDGYAPMLIELASLLPVDGPGGLADARRRVISFLEKQTGQRLGPDTDRWYRWTWNRPYDPHPGYLAFKAELYSTIDPRMGRFFAGERRFRIRLDEIVWGGVGVNGIPPLREPATTSGRDATYLDPEDVVFGIEIGGEARAYPRRILAWHEMAIDRVGGVDLTVVYCTLCGSVIPYASRHGEQHHRLGTSGLLYRSNKLMFDESTLSLWSTTVGRPVGGPLVDGKIRLDSYPVVTTTWSEWRAEHPDTTVLALPTGYRRDYGEGAAYRDYLADDDLMFGVPSTDSRLANKSEVLVFPYTVRASERGEGRPLAISIELLSEERLFTVERSGKRLLVLTTPGGANRAYEIGPERYRPADRQQLEDDAGRLWRITEDALVPHAKGPAPKPRVPAHRAFWFGWYAQHTDTELIVREQATKTAR
jgi:hypothetical protein